MAETTMGIDESLGPVRRRGAIADFFTRLVK